MISETKLDASINTSQFCINGCTSPYILDGNGKCGGILIYVRKDIPSKLLTTNFPNAEGFLSILEKRNGLSLVHLTHTIKQSSRIWKIRARLLTHSLQNMRIF